MPPKLAEVEQNLVGQWVVRWPETSDTPEASIWIGQPGAGLTVLLQAQECPVAGGGVLSIEDGVMTTDRDSVGVVALECDYVAVAELDDIDECLREGCEFALAGDQLKRVDDSVSVFEPSRTWEQGATWVQGVRPLGTLILAEKPEATSR